MEKKKYLAAVSGGPDSMALLNKYKNKIRVVCSVDYNKRKESYKDNLIVEEFCKKHQIAYELLLVDQKIYNQYHNNHNFQNKARKIRYDFFVQTAKKYNINDLLIAHNKDDWMESAYMQKAKHSLSLYYGIRKKSYYENLLIYRPLIHIRKNQLLNYCKDNNINFAIDYTNEMDLYTRNKIRNMIKNWKKHELIIFLFSIHWYNFKHHWLDESSKKCFNEWKQQDFNYSFFQHLRYKLKYHLIYSLLSFYKIDGISKNKIIHIIEFLNKKSDKKYRLENNKWLTIKNNRIIMIE